MSRIQLKLAGAFAAVALVLVLLMGSFAESGIASSTRGLLEEDLRDQAALVAELVGERPFAPSESAALTRSVRAAARAVETRITLIAPDGAVVADSDLRTEELAGVENHAERPEVRVALAGRTATATRLSDTVERELLYLATPRPGGQGVIRVAIDLADVERAVWALRRRLLIASALGLIAALGLSFAFSGLLVRPLERIRATVAAITSGALGTRVAWRSSDELGEIARAVDRMGEELELRLREITSEKEQLRAVVTGMEEGVLVLDAEGRITLANRRLCELFNTQGDLEGRTPIEALRSVELERTLAEALEGPSPVHREIQVESPRRAVLAVRAVRLPLDVGAGIVAVIDDRTELRRLEVVRRDFVANASHELRTPLTAIRGFAETLVESDVPPPEHRKYLEIILSHSRRLGALVDDLLELSRLESGKLELRTQPVEVRAAVERVASNLEALFARRDLSLVRGGLDVPPVKADPQALEQVLSNLLDNAAKYTEPGGRVEVRAELAGKQVRVSVQDTGIGIPAADRARIFERFYRVDKARSRELGGTGLGLAIVQHLLDGMGGRIGVDSTPGKGSTFSFTLPVA